MIDNSGASKVHRVYDAFGKILQETTTGGINTLFGFTGRPYDSDARANWNLNRWYDMYIGKWLSEDPIGFAAGDVNLLRYVDNSPMNFSDPLGLWEVYRNGGSRAKAVSEDGDTIKGLARRVGFRPGDYGRWITWSGERLIRNRGSISVKSITQTDKWCPDQEIEVPNTMLAAWINDGGVLGKWYTSRYADLGGLRRLGFNVVEHDNDDYESDQGAKSKADFLTALGSLTDSKELHGLFVSSHGSGTKVSAKGKDPDDEGWAVGPSVSIKYVDMHAKIDNKYRLAAVILEACGSDNPRARRLASGSSNGGIFFGTRLIFWPSGVHEQYWPQFRNVAEHWGRLRFGESVNSVRYGGAQATNSFWRGRPEGDANTISGESGGF